MKKHTDIRYFNNYKALNSYVLAHPEGNYFNIAFDTSKYDITILNNRYLALFKAAYVKSFPDLIQKANKMAWIRHDELLSQGFCPEDIEFDYYRDYEDIVCENPYREVAVLIYRNRALNKEENVCIDIRNAAYLKSRKHMLKQAAFYQKKIAIAKNTIANRLEKTVSDDLIQAILLKHKQTILRAENELIKIVSDELNKIP